MPAWAWLVPAVAAAVLGAAIAARRRPGRSPSRAARCSSAAVIAAVHHAEVVAHRVGEPFGTLVLAVAVTVIEASLILSMMLAGGRRQGGAAARHDLLRDHDHLQRRGRHLPAGGRPAPPRAVVPRRGRRPGPRGAGGAGHAVARAALLHHDVAGRDLQRLPARLRRRRSVALWAVFVFVQTVRHRDYFLPRRGRGQRGGARRSPLRSAQAWASFGLLLVSLVAVVGLAKVLSPTIERAIAAAGAPRTVIGIAIALLVLLPETWAAVRAARADRLQTSMNLALGSALASIGLTIPVVARGLGGVRHPARPRDSSPRTSCCSRSPSWSARSRWAPAARTSCRAPCTW